MNPRTTLILTVAAIASASPARAVPPPATYYAQADGNMVIICNKSGPAPSPRACCGKPLAQRTLSGSAQVTHRGAAQRDGGRALKPVASIWLVADDLTPMV